MWVRADVNGYICDFAVYTGKEGEVERDLGGKAVKKLVEPLAGGHYHIYFDNYFSSVKLLEDLQEVVLAMVLLLVELWHQLILFQTLLFLNACIGRKSLVNQPSS